MLNLSEFVSKSVFESSEKISPNTEDIKVLYDKFNEMYFDNKLPKNVDVAAKKIRSSRLGEQGYHKGCYISRIWMENGKYIMFSKKFGVMQQIYRNRFVWEPIPDKNTRIKDVLQLNPYIYINIKYNFTQNKLEDVLLHEMVHLYTNLGGYLTVQSHGKEFKAKCKEIRNLAKSKYGKTYELMTIAQDASEYEATENLTNELIEKIKKTCNTVQVLRFKLKKDNSYISGVPYQDRYIICSLKNFKSVWDDIKRFHGDNITSAKMSHDAYIEICKHENRKVGGVTKYSSFRDSNFGKIPEIFASINDWKDIPLS